MGSTSKVRGYRKVRKGEREGKAGKGKAGGGDEGEGG